MSTKHKLDGGRPYDVDAVGIIRWRNGRDHVQEARAEMVGAGAPENLILATGELHGRMLVARAVALNLFGVDWPDYVMDIYDRLKDLKDDFDHADDGPAVARPGDDGP